MKRTLQPGVGDAGTPGTRTRASTVGTLAIVAGALFAVAALVSSVTEWAWLAILAGFALLVYVVPQMHRYQAPADGWSGTWGSRLVVLGAAVMVGLGLLFVVWEAVGDAGEPAWVGVVWMLGFLSFVAGIVLFGIGSAVAGTLTRAAPAVMLAGLVAAVAIDMATGAFFEEDSTTTEWGLYIGVPLFGLGLAGMGYALRQRAADRQVAG